MSGFEVAGIILGAYPVLMSLVELYKETRSGKGARRLVRTLKTEEAIFNNFIHHLLAPPVISETKLARLTDPSQPDLDLWRDSTLQKSLKDRLGRDNASIVLEILQEINGLLPLIQNDLTVTDHGMNILRRFRSSLRTAKHCLPRSSLQEHLMKLKSYNEDLERLLADRSFISYVNYRRPASAAKRYLRRDISSAIDVYHAINNGYRCSCQVAHLANFGFPKIADDFGEEDSNDMTGDEQFELLFPINKLGLADPFPSSNMGSTTNVDDAIGSITRRVSISEYNKDSYDHEHKSIDDLCDLVNRFDASNAVTDTRLGILKMRGKQYELQSPLYIQGLKSVQSLDHLLVGQRFRLSRKERMDLALRLSYAVLQFYSTPWIEASWTWGDFCIDKRDDPQLFVTRKFYSSHSRNSTPTACKSSDLKLSDIAEEPILIKLGCALIELALGSRLAEMRLEAESQKLDSDILDFATAKKLVSDGRISREESCPYEEVVKACLSGQFSCNSQLKSIDSRQATFHRDVEQSIIEPLHQIWSTSWGSLS